MIIEKNINGLSEDWKLLKYDNGIVLKNFKNSKRILMNIGDFELKGDFIDSLGNLSNLDKN